VSLVNPFGNPSDVVHLHLLLNHIPTIGSIVGVGVFLVGLLRREQPMRTAALEVLFLVALATVPAYVTGGGAIAVVEHAEGTSREALGAHRDAAFVAFTVMQVTGAAAWLALWMFRRRLPAAGPVSLAAGTLAVITLALMGNVANIGGEIRHPEIGAAVAVPFPGIDAAALANSVVSHLWVWPALETLHFVGMSLSFGVLLVMNIHLLGLMPGTPFLTVHRLLPWGMLGVMLNVATGMLFFSGNIQQYMENPAFHWKVVLLVLAGLNYLYLTVVEDDWVSDSAGRIRPITRALAVSSLAVWIGILYFGRMLPYLRGVLTS